MPFCLPEFCRNSSFRDAALSQSYCIKIIQKIPRSVFRYIKHCGCGLDRVSACWSKSKCFSFAPFRPGISLFKHRLLTWSIFSFQTFANRSRKTKKCVRGHLNDEETAHSLFWTYIYINFSSVLLCFAQLDIKWKLSNLNLSYFSLISETWDLCNCGGKGM